MTDVVVPDEEPTFLILDELTERLAPLRLLRAGENIDVVLDSFGAQGEVEANMLIYAARNVSIAHPTRFEEAHRRVISALEVYSRLGPSLPSRLPAVPRGLKWIVSHVVRILVRAIVRNHSKDVTRDMRALYALREAGSAPDSAEFAMFTRAREQMDTITGDVDLPAIPLPTFLGVGAIVSAMISWVQRGIADELGQIVMVITFILGGLPVFWCIVTAAAVARRRQRVTLQGPLDALYEVLGDAGGPPSDPAKRFAIVASAALFGLWVVVPVLVVMASSHFW